MSKKHLLVLDFDGVVNGLGGSQNFPHEFQSCILACRGKEYAISYRLELIQKINELSQRNDVDVIWLTTWVEYTEKFTQLGLTQFPYLSPLEQLDDVTVRHGYIWKSKALVDYLKRHDGEYEKVVWCDDDYKVFDWLPIKEENFITITPNPYFGLLNKQVDMITRFFNDEPLYEPPTGDRVVNNDF